MDEEATTSRPSRLRKRRHSNSCDSPEPITHPLPSRVLQNPKRRRSLWRSISQPQRGHSQPGAAGRCSLLMKMALEEAERTVETPPFPKPKSSLRAVTAFEVNISPGGSYRLGDSKAVNIKLRPQPPFVLEEKVAAADLSDEECMDLLESGNHNHIQRWLRTTNITPSHDFDEHRREPGRALAIVSPIVDSTHHSSVVEQVAAGTSRRAEANAVRSPMASTKLSDREAGDDQVYQREGDGNDLVPVASTRLSEGEAGGDQVRQRMGDGSDLDSDYDNEFDLEDQVPLSSIRTRGIDTEGLDPQTLRAMETMEEALDAHQENLLPGDQTHFDWVENFDSFREVRKEFLVDFPGPIREFESVISAFTEIWDIEIMTLIAEETNRYAEQVISQKRSRGELTEASRLKKWVPTNVEELYLLFAIFIYMGIDPRTSLKEYWTTSTRLEMPRFRELMSYNRYILLNKFLHFVDNTDLSQSCLQSDGTRLSAKLFKISPIINHLNSKFQSLYVLDEYVSIDESLTLFKGRLSWIQCIRSKAARFGIKSFELCESSTGYMAKFVIYVGKDSDRADAIPTELGTDLGGKTTQIVLDMLKGLEGKGYCVTMDNFYNSPALSRHLKTIGFDCLGTLRTIRKHVPEAVKKLRPNVPRGTIVARHCGDLSVLSWKDSKVVTMISTYHDNSTVLSRRAGQERIKPVSVRDYNTTMGGIDLKDQKLAMYLMERKRGLKWYIKIFKRLLNVSIHNAFIICRRSRTRMNLNPIDHRSFRYELAEVLVQKSKRVSNVHRIQVVSDTAIRLRRNILHVPITESGKTARRRRCVRCLAIGKRAESRSGCRECNVGLCQNISCWVDWHSKDDLTEP